jgi:hypothetical protein
LVTKAFRTLRVPLLQSDASPRSLPRPLCRARFGAGLVATFVRILVLQPQCEHLPGVDVRFFWAPTAGAIRRRLPDIFAWDRSNAAAAPGVMVFAAGLWDVLHNRNETTSLPHPLRS